MELFKQIEELNEKYIKVWADVANIESPSNYKKGVDEVNEYFINIAKENNWEIEVFEQERLGNAVCITMNPDKERVITLSGHTDTVHPVGSFGENPVRFDEKNIYGPGVTDCKGGIVAGFLAMEALQKTGFKDKQVRMILQGNEEIGSGLENKASIEYMCQKSKDTELFLNLEGTNRGKVVTERKGIARFIIKVSGRAAHSAWAEKGANAIAQAAHKIISIESLREKLGITCSCNLVNGGIGQNTVPDSCEFTVDMRFLNKKELELFKKEIDKIVSTVEVEGCTSRVEMTNLRPAMELRQENIDALDKINHIFKKNGFEPLEGSYGNGGSDAADISECGITTIDSIGTDGSKLHTTDEYGELASLEIAAKRLVAIISEW